MAERRPLVVVGGVTQELPSGDTLPGGGGSSLNAKRLNPVHALHDTNYDLEDDQDVDGNTPLTAFRYAFRGQTDPIENGIWVFMGSGTWVRPADFTAGFNADGADFFVHSGTHAGEQWIVAGPEVDGDEVHLTRVIDIPSGGSDGQVLTKTSGSDYAVAWETLTVGVAVNDIEDATGATAIDCGSNNFTLSAFGKSIIDVSDSATVTYVTYGGNSITIGSSGGSGGTDLIAGTINIGHASSNYVNIMPNSTGYISMYGGSGAPKGNHIPDPSGGMTEDSECRTALVALLTYLRTRGDIASS